MFSSKKREKHHPNTIHNSVPSTFLSKISKRVGGNEVLIKLKKILLFLTADGGMEQGFPQVKRMGRSDQNLVRWDGVSAWGSWRFSQEKRKYLRRNV